MRSEINLNTTFPHLFLLPKLYLLFPQQGREMGMGVMINTSQIFPPTAQDEESFLQETVLN